MHGAKRTIRKGTDPQRLQSCTTGQSERCIKRSQYIAGRKTKSINNNAGNGTTGPKARQSAQRIAVAA